MKSINLQVSHFFSDVISMIHQVFKQCWKMWMEKPCMDLQKFLVKKITFPIYYFFWLPTRERERELWFPGSPSRCLKVPAMSQTKACDWGLNAGLPQESREATCRSRHHRLLGWAAGSRSKDPWRGTKHTYANVVCGRLSCEGKQPPCTSYLISIFHEVLEVLSYKWEITLD